MYVIGCHRDLTGCKHAPGPGRRGQDNHPTGNEMPMAMPQLTPMLTPRSRQRTTQSVQMKHPCMIAAPGATPNAA